MGWGNYEFIGFGLPSFKPPKRAVKAYEKKHPGSLFGEDWCDAYYPLNVRGPYECTAPYLGIRLLVSYDGNFPDGACALGDFERLCTKALGKNCLAATRKEWAKWQQVALERFGVTVPDGVLFWARDYD